MPQILTYKTVDPPAGEPIPDTEVPTGETWQIQYIVFALIASSTVANRLAQVKISDAGGLNSSVISHSNVLQTANQTNGYIFAPGMALTNLLHIGNGYITAPLPTGLTLEGGMIITLWTENSAAVSNDDFTYALIGYMKVSGA